MGSSGQASLGLISSHKVSVSLLFYILSRLKFCYRKALCIGGGTGLSDRAEFQYVTD